jgi:uncharacterized membrane protein YoaK (UPF0700 family)
MTMGGVFAANMTGNTVLAGIALARSEWAEASHHLLPLVAFFVGAMLSRLVLRLSGSPRAGLVVEAAILAIVGFLPIDKEPQVMILAVAMGIQASAITHFATHSVSTVVVTSTLARTADAALDRLWPGDIENAPTGNNGVMLAMSWAGYLVGAIAGALLLKVFAWPLLVPAALLLLLLF